MIGSGPAGATVAAALADSGREVVVVEAGPGGPRPPGLVGLDLVAASAESTRLWDGLRVRDRPGGPRRGYRQGRGLGGGSMINGMLLTPGDTADYRRWEVERGCAGWGEGEMGSWVERALGHWPTVRGEPGPVAVALGRAAAADGLPVGGTSLEADRLGVLTAELTAVNGHRWSSADAHLEGDGEGGPTGGPGRLARRGGGPSGPAPWFELRTLERSPITVVSSAPVERLIAGGGRASHRVELATGDEIVAPLVVVCAGAVATPVLLQGSGLSDRPVGRSLRDHPSYVFTVVLEPGVDRASANRVVSTVIRWSSGPDRPGDLQAVVVDRVESGDGPPLAVVIVGLMTVEAAGTVTRSVDGGAEVVTGALTEADDRRRLRVGVRRAARWLRALEEGGVAAEVHIDERGTPLPVLEGLSDGPLDALIASRPGPYAHPACTCPMGPDTDPRAVVAFEPGRAGELIGHPGIRLADASVFPHLVRGGLQLPVAALAARVADDIVSTG